MPELVHAERTALTKAQAIQLLEALPFALRAIVLVLALTGMRIGELCGLRWRRVNLTATPALMDGETLEGHTMVVREAYVRVYGKGLPKEQKGGQYQEVKTRKSRRAIPLPALVVRVLGQVFELSKFKDPSSPVFAGRNGTPIDAHNELARKLKPALIELKLPPISWHDLRHSAATFADQAGLTESERQRILGHASGRMTQHYTKAHIEHARGPMESMAEGFSDVMDKKAVVVEIRKKAS